MRPNPGGHIPPDQVVGRDELIQRLWDALEQQSLVLVAERRIGKTTVVGKMVYEPPDGVLPLLIDVEGVRTPLDFGEIIYNHLRAHLPAYRKAAVGVHKLLKWTEGAGVGPVTFPSAAGAEWKPLLQSILADLMEAQQEQHERVVLILDELPLMLQKVVKAHNEETGVDLLDTLRGCRQTLPGLRMVYTGSVGLHHVIRRLRQSDYIGSPTNDMLLEEVPVLAPRHAKHLAAMLLEGAGARVAGNADDTAQAVASAVDGHPFLIHHVVRELGALPAVDEPTVERTVRTCLTDGLDRWDMSHFRDRIPHYYTPEEQPVVRAVLDAVAAATEPLPLPELLQRVKAVVPVEDDEAIRSAIGLMRRDHYLQMDEDGRCDFKLLIVKRWWRLDRGIET